jgi:hypothetical protein
MPEKIDNKPEKVYKITTTETFDRKGELIKKTRRVTYYSPTPEDEG